MHSADRHEVRLKPTDAGEAPPRPEYFDHRYVLPLHRVKFLEQQNIHPRDARCVFYEEPHIYEIDGHPAQCSVSGLIHPFESEFEPSHGISAMKRSRSSAWPRLGYVHNARRIERVDDFATPNTGALLVHAKDGTTVASLDVGAIVGEEGVVVLMMLRDAATKPIKHAEEEWYVFDRAMTDLEICQKWEKNGEEARNRGTEAHLQMELWFNSEPTRLDDPEVGVGLQFVRDCLEPIGAKAYRTEWVIFGDEENVAGCIDLAVELPSGDLYLIDWKRSEKLKKKMKGYSRMAAPFTHLDDCSGCAYAVQLSSYQYIIEKYYGKRVAGRALASIHPTAPFTTTVPYLAKEVEYLMARRRAEHGTRLRLSAMPLSDHLRCAKTNVLVTTGVRTEEGVLYDEKSAKLLDVQTKLDIAVTQAAEALMAEHTPPVPWDPKTAKSWRDVFAGPNSTLLEA